MNEEKRRIIASLFYPGLLVLVMWLVFLVEVIFSYDLGIYGLQPLKLSGLPGIITAPFLHADFSHIAANTLPFLFLSALLFYFYNDIAWTILILVWIMTGTWVWLFARGNGIHVGASGVVYGLAAFLFLSGIIRRDSKLMAITLLIAFLYGGLIWGIFPQMFPNKPISWESHLMGLLSGTILAIYFRKSGPQKKEYIWEENEEDEDGTEEWKSTDIEPETRHPDQFTNT